MYNYPAVPPLRLAKIEALVFRAPIKVPVQTSFGLMHNRPAVLVRVEDHEGVVGWGEIWCNFPSVGAEHRARLLEATIAPILLEREWESPQQAFAHVTAQLRVLAIQTGEPGPLAQCIAGADIAVWDLAARRASLPLWKMLGGGAEIKVYASGLNPTDPEILAAKKHAEGYAAFKLKVGFGEERDLANLRALRATLGEDVTLMVDANQAWDLNQAQRMSQKLADFKLRWLEEPLAADTPLATWKTLAANSPIGLAAGENMRGENEFGAAIDSGAFAVMQPDIGKWGGFSGCLPVAAHAVAKGLTFCPHWLGGGIGLTASMHLKAAIGGEGYVEVDANPNPLREVLACPVPAVGAQGVIRLTNESGLGVAPDLAASNEFRVQ